MSGTIKIAVMSDLHIEFDDWEKAKTNRLPSGHPLFGPDLRAQKAAGPDLVALAGDIDVKNPVGYAAEMARYLGVPVVLVAGNHDFYHYEHPYRVEELRRQSAACRDVVFLENGVFETEIRGNRLRVLGCTLWTDYALFSKDGLPGGQEKVPPGLERVISVEEAMQAANTCLNDHREIFTGQGKGLEDDTLRPADALRLHKESLSWLKTELAKPWDGATIIVTHHAPSVLSVAERWRKDILSAAYVSRLDGFVAESGAALWVHGHTHSSFDYRLGNTRVVCNPRGFVEWARNPEFKVDLIVDM